MFCASLGQLLKSVPNNRVQKQPMSNKNLLDSECLVLNLTMTLILNPRFKHKSIMYNYFKMQRSTLNRIIPIHYHFVTSSLLIGYIRFITEILI